VAQANDLPPSVIRFLEEEDRLLDHAGIVEEMFAFHPSVQSLIHKTSRTILKLAGLGRVVIVGRAANLVTRDLPGGYHFRLVGSPDRRIEYLMECFDLSRDAARERMEREDRARRRYVKRYFGRDVEDPLLYHLVIDTDRIPREEAATTIVHTVRSYVPEAPQTV
jgi:cytidylate kinase